MDESTANLSLSREVPQPPKRIELVLADEYVTSAHYYAAEGKPRGRVLYVHGIQSHPGWFSTSAAAMASAGYSVLMPTRRGSGDNQLARGHAESAAQLLDDLEHAARFAVETAGGLPLHLVGVSWGGKIASAYAIHPKRSLDIASLTLIAPGIVPAVDVPLLMKLSIALALLVSPQRRFEIPLSDVELFTDNPQMQAYLRDDPLRLHRASAKFLLASRELDVQLSRARAGCLQVPTTLILAQRDRIIDNRKTQRAVERLSVGKLNVQLLAGAHTLEFESDPSALVAAILNPMLKSTV